MRKVFLLSFMLCLFVLSLPGMGDEPVKKDSEEIPIVPDEVQAILDRKAVSHNSWSLLIEEYKGEKALLRLHPDTPRKPASNVKILTTACAYNRLGWNHKFNGTTLIKAIGPINKHSINSRADNLMRHIGMVLSKEGTLCSGGQDVLEWCQGRLGLDMEGAVLKDGSGLSHQNRLTARQITGVLRYMLDHHSKFDESLSVGGRDGTLRHRFRRKDMLGRVYGKTGTLTGVITLSGVFRKDDGSTLIFSLLANNVKDKNATRHALDDCLAIFK